MALLASGVGATSGRDLESAPVPPERGEELRVAIFRLFWPTRVNLALLVLLQRVQNGLRERHCILRM